MFISHKSNVIQQVHDTEWQCRRLTKGMTKPEYWAWEATITSGAPPVVDYSGETGYTIVECDDENVEARLVQLDDYISRKPEETTYNIKYYVSKRDVLDSDGNKIVDVPAHKVTDEDGNITLLNKTAQQIFNLENSEYLGLRLSDVIRDFEIIQMASDCVDIEESIQDEIEIPEVRRYLSVTATPIGSGSGGGVLITVHDLTNIRQLENTRKEFVSNVSHELRSPLASVKAMVGSLESGALEDKKAANDFIARIDKDVDRMTSLVSDLLELSRLESGQEDIELEPVELRSLVDDSISMVTNQVLDGPDILSKIFENVEILGNKQKVTQILLNLLQNSVKFTPSGGTITVEARSNGGFVEVSVLDTGIGIAAEHLPHLFERFYKVDKARRDGGTGLGLAIVKHIVQAHGGAVYADSVEGEGSAFYFTVPLLNTVSREKM